MKNVLIIPNTNKDPNLAITKRVASVLQAGGAAISSQSEYSAELGSKAIDLAALPRDFDLIVVIGGDGSMLDASTYAIELDVPMLGVNLGKVGYLSEVDVDSIETLEKLFTEEYTIETKELLGLTLTSGGSTRRIDRLAVNDIIISHENFLGIADFRLEKSSGEAVRYRADGIIFSTPVGSTAYSLSAGGPIVAHNVDSILITPIAPHSFFNRSILLGANEKLTVKNDGATELNISIDGRLLAALKCGEECTVAVSDKVLKMLTFDRENMFSTLFKKMKISEL